MNRASNPDRLLIVDAANDIAEMLKNASCHLGFVLKTTDNIDAFRHACREFDPTVILLQLQTSGNEGIKYLKELARQDSAARIIVASNLGNQMLSTISQLGAVLGLQMAGTLQQPVSIHTLRQQLKKLMHASAPLTATRLSAAIDVGQIKPHFQPKLLRDKENNWYVGEVEALARWHQGDGSVTMPDSFIGLAEDSGLIGILTDSMLEQVVDQLGRWNKRDRRLRAAVNLSPSLLTDGELPDRLERLLQKHDVDNKQLIIEVTDNIAMQYTRATTEVLGRLRFKKFGLAIDDFGAGYTSLEQLYRMPFDELKIDGSFIKSCQTNKEIRVIIEAMVMLGQKLGMTVCAEGVETVEAFDFLASTGCDKQQGFLIGRPVPASELEPLLDRPKGGATSIRAIA